VLFQASIAALEEGFDVYVTSMQDKTHGPVSLHPFGLAIDLGVAGNVPAQLEKLFSRLARRLPPTYDVVFEGNHVHVEYDPHRAVKDATPPAVTRSRAHARGRARGAALRRST
jgi:hypothetical protein